MPDWLHFFPPLNASLNATSGLLLLAGYIAIRKKKVAIHRRLMLSACLCSLLFLSCYLYYHFHAGTTRFSGTGWSRPLYFSILTSHTILAVTVLPLAIITVTRGLRNQVERHRRIARWTFPIWMYVSVTGVLVYFFLYQWYPGR